MSKSQRAQRAEQWESANGKQVKLDMLGGVVKFLEMRADELRQSLGDKVDEVLGRLAEIEDTLQHLTETVQQLADEMRGDRLAEQCLEGVADV